MNKTFVGVLIGSIRTFMKNVIVVPIVIIFYAATEKILFNSNNVLDYFAMFISGGSFSIVFMIIIFLFLIVLLYLSLVAYLQRKIKGSNPTANSIIIDVKKNYLYSLVTYLYLLVSFVFILFIINNIISQILFVILPYSPIVKILDYIIDYLSVSVLIYGIYYSLNNKFNIKNLSIAILKYTFSRKALYLAIILTIIFSIFIPIQFKIIDSILSNMLVPNDFFAFISSFETPIWFYYIGWIFKGILTSFILVYVVKTSSTEQMEKSETLDTNGFYQS